MCLSYSIAFHSIQINESFFSFNIWLHDFNFWTLCWNAYLFFFFSSCIFAFVPRWKGTISVLHFTYTHNANHMGYACAEITHSRWLDPQLTYTSHFNVHLCAPECVSVFAIGFYSLIFGFELFNCFLLPNRHLAWLLGRDFAWKTNENKNKTSNSVSIYYLSDLLIWTTYGLLCFVMCVCMCMTYKTTCF